MFDTYIVEAQRQHGQKSDRELMYHVLTDLHLLIKKVNKMADEQLTQEQLAAQFDALSDQLDKSKTEVLSEVAALEAQINSGAQGNGTTIIPTAAFSASLARLKAAVQSVDDLNADAPTGATTTPPDSGSTTPPDSGTPTTPAPPADGTTPAPGTSDGSTADGSTTVAPV